MVTKGILFDVEYGKPTKYIFFTTMKKLLFHSQIRNLSKSRTIFESAKPVAGSSEAMNPIQDFLQGGASSRNKAGLYFSYFIILTSGRICGVQSR